MNPRKPIRKQLHDVDIAYAANGRGDGVAYVAIAGEEPRRVAFHVERRPALHGWETGYAALLAVTAALRGDGYRAVRIGIADERIVDDLANRRPLPQALALLYVQLKCRLNMFARVDVVTRPPSEDLAARARAEVELAVAA